MSESESLSSILTEIERVCPICDSTTKNLRIKYRTHVIQDRHPHHKPRTVKWLSNTDFQPKPYAYFLAFCQNCGYTKPVREFREPKEDSKSFEKLDEFLNRSSNGTEQRTVQGFLHFIKNRPDRLRYDPTTACSMHMLYLFQHRKLREHLRFPKQLGRVTMRLSWILEDIENTGHDERTSYLFQIADQIDVLPRRSEKALNQAIDSYRTFLSNKHPREHPRTEVKVRSLISDLLLYQDNPEEALRHIQDLLSLMREVQQDLQEIVRESDREKPSGRIQYDDPQKTLNWIKERTSDIQYKRDDLKKELIQKQLPELKEALREKEHPLEQSLDDALYDELKHQFHPITLNKYNQVIEEENESSSENGFLQGLFSS